MGFCFETRSSCVALASLEVSVDQVGLELSIILPLLSSVGSHRHNCHCSEL